jgi:hypothetical protein
MWQVYTRPTSASVFFVLYLYFDRTCFIVEKLLCYIQDGGRCPRWRPKVFILGLYSDQQQPRDTGTYFDKLSKNDALVQDGGSMAVPWRFLALIWEFSIFFHSPFCIRLV